MVDRQIVARGVRDAGVQRAMREVPRERFLPAAMREFAYDDSPLPIGSGQTISQPYIVARMLEAANLAPGQHVLEVGAGSGYAAAVMQEIAGDVRTIERHDDLAARARERLADAGYPQVQVRTGDGTLGWPEAAPFDAILVAAGGPRVPEPLLRQLKPGGRLVMPLGDSDQQRLVRIVRTDDGGFATEDLGGVRFVPLIGHGGWRPEPPAANLAIDDSAAVARLRSLGTPLPDIDARGFADAFAAFDGAKVMLLGECSHGTSEFYRARAAITRRRIEVDGVRVVALEADWPDVAVLDRHVRGLPPGSDPEPPFRRFPRWMWRNREFAAFVAWLRDFNAGRAADDRVGLYGLDLYSVGRSMRAVIDYLDDVDPAAAATARARYGCLMPWAREPSEYGRMQRGDGHARCETAVLATLRGLLAKRLEYAAADGVRFFDASRNAHLVRDAEAYYRAMYRGGAEAWNVRDRHMADTLEALLAEAGAGARAVVWAHNSHVGDARETEMGQQRGENNLGELCRRTWPTATAIVGFGTHAGTVAAADDWDAPMQVMVVRPARDDSVEHLFQRTGEPRLLADLRPGTALHATLAGCRLQRFIGVIYRPHTERFSHYAEAVLSRQYDAYVWFAQTRAVTPLDADAGAAAADGVPDTWPSAL